MTRISTLLLTLVVAATVQAQTITNVVLSPATPTECDLVDINVVGTYPSSNFAASSFSLNVVGSTIELVYRAASSGIGSPVITPFNEPLPPGGPWIAGNYQLVATLELITNGGNDTNVVDMYNGTVTVLPEPVPDPGVDGFHTICNVGPDIPLISLLGGTPDTWGEWLDPFGQPHGPDLVPGQDPAGLYTYLFDQNPPCSDTLSQVVISYLPNNDPGMGGPYSICETGSPVDLFTVLTGGPDMGGTWTGPNGTSFNGTYDPATNASGAYTYTVPGIAPCDDPFAVIDVLEVEVPEAGTGGTALVCETDTAFVLYSVLSGAPTNGKWIDPLGFNIGTGTNVVFNAMTNFPGQYAYVVEAPPCAADSAYVVVTVVLSIVKGAVISDPYGGSEPIPGAVITYTLTVTATGSGTALDVVISDPVPLHTAYHGGTLALDGGFLTDAADADAGDVGGSTPGAVTVQLGNLPAGAPAHVITFDVGIN